MKKSPRISEAEWTVMKAVWRRPGLSAEEVIADLASTSAWSPPTVKTLLNRLLGKKAVRFEKKGKAYLYFPIFSEAEMRAAEADSFVDRIFDGALSPMVSHFVKSGRLKEDELKELRRILREGKEEL